MHDQDSYSLYCAMLLQESQQHGSALNGIDPAILDECRRYLNASYHHERKIQKEICL